MDDEIIQQVRKAKAKVAEKIGGKGFENYLAYFQKQEAELEKRGIKLVDKPLKKRSESNFTEDEKQN
jgi:hypothetical protein